MAFSVEQLRERRRTLVATLEEVRARYDNVIGTDSLAEITSGNDIVSLENQIGEIDAALSGLNFQEDPEVPRREPFPTTPTVLVDGIPPRQGVPSNAKILRKGDGSFYYVDASGKVIPRV